MDDWTQNILTSLLVIVLTIVILLIIQFLARRLKIYADGLEGIRRERRNQLLTFFQVFVWIGSVTMVFIAILMFLSQFGVDITPFLASVGIAGLALSLGAQTLIKDFIGGFLILLENQYIVGDTIKLDSLTGEVERISLRATYIRDLKGLQYIIPNGEVRIVANQNKEWTRALVELNIAYGENLDHVISVLENVANSLVDDPEYNSGLLDKPVVTGPVVLADWEIRIRISVMTQPDRQVEITRELQKRVLHACQQEAITLTYPRHDVRLGGRDG